MDTIKRLISLITLLLVVGIGVYVFFTFQQQRNGYINVDRAAVIKEMRELQRLETATFTIEKIIDAGTNQGGKVQELLFGDKLLLIAQGEVIAGFDLSQIQEEDIKVEGQNLTFTLPKPQILVTKLNNEQTKVYDRSTGIFSKGDKDLESKAREQAEESIRQAACQSNILQQASDNARKQLSTLFRGLGFAQVTIAIPEASCI